MAQPLLAEEGVVRSMGQPSHKAWVVARSRGDSFHRLASWKTMAVEYDDVDWKTSAGQTAGKRWTAVGSPSSQQSTHIRAILCVMVNKFSGTQDMNFCAHTKTVGRSIQPNVINVLYQH